MVVLNNYPVGIQQNRTAFLRRTMYTTSNCAGVAGTCENASKGMGVQGAAKAANGVGVFGYAGSVVPSDVLPEGTGVVGKGSNFGTWGMARTGTGVGAYGESSSNAGVYGKSQTNAGVYGESPIVAVLGSSTAGIGVQGTSTTNAGVYGTSPHSGVFGTSTGSGVWGNTTTGIGVFGQATEPPGFAGQFVGNVLVGGSFTVVNGAKSAAVPGPDGSLRRMYCQEAPEPWFEDFGRGKLGAGGKAAITLPSDFASVVKTDDYLVFVTEIGDTGGLFVADQTATGFTVQARASAIKEGAFSYRIVARRRDLAPGRMEKVTLPKAPDRPPTATALDPKSFPKRPASPDLTTEPSPPAASDS